MNIRKQQKDYKGGTDDDGKGHPATPVVPRRVAVGIIIVAGTMSDWVYYLKHKIDDLPNITTFKINDTHRE